MLGFYSRLASVCIIGGLIGYLGALVGINGFFILSAVFVLAFIYGYAESTEA